MISSPCAFRNVDVTSTCDADLDFTAPFTLTARSAAGFVPTRLCDLVCGCSRVGLSRGVHSADGTVTSFVVHFDALFDLSASGGARTSFTTSPLDTPTHWKQTSLYLKEALRLTAGDERRVDPNPRPFPSSRRPPPLSQQMTGDCPKRGARSGPDLTGRGGYDRLLSRYRLQALV